jgi:hypothetical protein
VHESIGHSYDSFDLDTLDPKTVSMNLNEDNNIKSSRFWQAYDLVTNHGTTEHLFNQASAFKLMHDVCKVGGVMVHVLPCIEPNHGLYCYSPVLFEALANHNQYDSLLLTVTDQPNNNTAPPFYRGYSEADLKKTCYVYVALKKKIDADFVMPSQIFRGGNK